MATMIEDQALTDNFSLYTLTITSHAEFQAKNREVTPEQIEKLRSLARLLEHIQYVIGGPVVINSAYRCKPLNDAVGSTDRSQHMLCEAVDWHPGDKNMDIEKAFRMIWKDIVVSGANVGQLIHENDNGKIWIHASLGVPFRPPEKCKQILRAERNAQGKMIYTRLA